MQWHLLHQDHIQLSAPLAWLLITIPIWIFVEDVKLTSQIQKGFPLF